MIEKLGEYREAADNDTNRHLGPCPKAHDNRVVGNVGRFNDLPGIVCTHNRRHTRPGNLCQSLSGPEDVVSGNTQYHFSDSRPDHEIARRTFSVDATYRKPVAKTAVIKIFLFLGICNFLSLSPQVTGISPRLRRKTSSKNSTRSSMKPTKATKLAPALQSPTFFSQTRRIQCGALKRHRSARSQIGVLQGCSECTLSSRRRVGLRQ